ncbi:MAG: DUF4153 domain-containing protein, partial [Candidatus Eremiobacterota bacterium]
PRQGGAELPHEPPRGGAGGPVALLAALFLQTFGLAFSAVHRMSLYIDAYGLTLTRTYVVMALAGICLSLLLVLVCLLRRPDLPWLTARIALLGLTMMALAAVLDVERLVAEVNVTRSAHLDVGYLGGLSADVLPVLDRLKTHPDPKVRNDANEARLRVLCTVGQPAWQSWNLSRARAEHR